MFWEKPYLFSFFLFFVRSHFIFSLLIPFKTYLFARFCSDARFPLQFLNADSGVFVSFWRFVRSCCQAARLSFLHCLSVVAPTKAGVQIPPTSALVLQKHCPSAGLILFRRNSLPTLQKAVELTRSAPTCFVSQGQDLLSMLRDRRPLCETTGIKKHICNSKIDKNLHLFDMLTHIRSPDTFQFTVFWAAPEWTTLDRVALTPHLYTLMLSAPSLS